MGIIKSFYNQTRKPSGLLGELMIKRMGYTHANLAEWTMQFMPDDDVSQIVEIGCGGGQNIGRLLRKYTRARITGVDHSLLSVEKSIENNKTFVDAGRCDIFKADVSLLPVEDNKYDLATAFETIYFWEDLERCFKEVYRSLKPGGTFIISNTSDGTDKESLMFEKIIDGMKNYTVEEIADCLQRAGFARAEAMHHIKLPWMAVVAQK